MTILISDFQIVFLTLCQESIKTSSPLHLSNLVLKPRFVCLMVKHTDKSFSFFLLDVALEREVEGDMLLADMGSGMPFRPGMFDGAISISAVQWLCYADSAIHRPAKRLYKLFMTLFASLVM